jgi:methylmalonyl-CoA/ethylmalonyl-CoA epimerase
VRSSIICAKSAPVPDPSLHHVGYVVTSIAESIDRWQHAVLPVSISEAFGDAIQRARVIFLGLPPDGAVKLELVEPLGPDSRVASFDQKGGGLHHLCFEVDDIEQQIGKMKLLKAMLIRRPQPAVAFGGRRIAWMRTRDKLLVEYLERPAR